MQVVDVMSAPAITVAPETSVHDIALLLSERRISGVPVVSGTALVGVVSERDLLHRREIGTGGNKRPASWWGKLVGDDQGAAEYVRSHARSARDVMSSDVVAVVEDAPLSHAIALFERHRVRRLPVLRAHRVAGIVTRADIVRAFALRSDRAQPHALPDESIRARLLAELGSQAWWRPAWSSVSVSDGIVHFRGLFDSTAQRRAARVAAENVPGVRGVIDERTPATDWKPML